MKPKNPWKRPNQDAKREGDGKEREKREFAASVLEAIKNKSLERFQAKLTEAGGTHTETFSVLPSGDLQVQGEDPEGPDLLACSPAKEEKTQEEGVSVTRIHYRPDDLRIGARRILEKFPEISFTFHENSTRDKITFTATLKKKES